MAWPVELEGAVQDVKVVSGANPEDPLSIPLVIMGDISMRAAVGGAWEPAWARVQRWAALLADRSLDRLSPGVGQGLPAEAGTGMPS